MYNTTDNTKAKCMTTAPTEAMTLDGATTMNCTVTMTHTNECANSNDKTIANTNIKTNPIHKNETNTDITKAMMTMAVSKNKANTQTMTDTHL